MESDTCLELDCTTGCVASGSALGRPVEVENRPDSARHSIADLVRQELAMVDLLVGMKTMGGTLARAVKLRHGFEQEKVRILQIWI